MAQSKHEFDPEFLEDETQNTGTSGLLPNQIIMLLGQDRKDSI